MVKSILRFVVLLVLTASAVVAMLASFAFIAQAADNSLNAQTSLNHVVLSASAEVITDSASLARIATIPITGVVLSNANLRAGPSTSSAILGQAPQGKQITIVGCNTACDWYQLRGSQWIAGFLVGELTAPMMAATLSLTAYTDETQSPAISLRLMTYNVLCGATTEGCGISGNIPPYDRRPALLEYLSKIRPSILGIQEANGWSEETPTSTVEYIAQSLGMNYYLAETGTNFDLVLLTQFPILETTNLSAQVQKGGSHGALGATLLLTTGDLVDVYVVHLDPYSTTLVGKQIDALIELMPTGTDRTSILMGDFNNYSTRTQFDIMKRLGWKTVDTNTGGFLRTEGIDQIWINSPDAWKVRPRMRTPVEQGGAVRVSDHNPVWADVTIVRN